MSMLCSASQLPPLCPLNVFDMFLCFQYKRVSGTRRRINKRIISLHNKGKRKSKCFTILTEIKVKEAEEFKYIRISWKKLTFKEKSRIKEKV